MAKKAWPTYAGLVEKIRGSPVVYPDETGWRVAGRSAWLWAVTNRRETVYAIYPGRGFAEKTATRGAVRFPRQVQAHLQHALALRDRRDAGEIGEHGLKVAKGRLQASLGRTLRGRFTNPDNGRLARHLLRYENALFVFLDHPDMEATDWPSEHAIRPAVVNRKSAGGGARTEGQKPRLC